MIGHGVERVASELVVSDEYQEQVKLHPALCVDDLHLTLSHLLALQHRVFHHRFQVVNSAEEVEVPHIQMLGAENQLQLLMLCSLNSRKGKHLRSLNKCH